MPHVTLQLVPSKSQWAGLTILAMFCVGVGLVARGRIGRCHTAKHMAIQAYRANGDTSLEAIRAQDGLDSDCLCQIIPPAAGLFLVAFVVSILAAATDFVGLAIWLGLVISVNLACACCLLLLSKQQRCSRIPGNKWLTLQLHRRLIRVEPTDVELTVAYRALTQLVKLHES